MLIPSILKSTPIHDLHANSGDSLLKTIILICLFRKNPVHFKEYSHDFVDSGDTEGNNIGRGLLTWYFAMSSLLAYSVIGISSTSKNMVTVNIKT